MRKFFLAAVLLLMAGGPVWAASYQRIDGLIIDPIQSKQGGDLAYSGNNLEPGADLVGADLVWAHLRHADLTEANLTNANLDWAGMFSADLSNADLSGANLGATDLGWANLSEANLTSAKLVAKVLPFGGNVNLVGVNLSGARLYSADLSGAYFRPDTTFLAEVTIWTGAKYSLNAVDNNSNPIPDTIFPALMDQAWRDAAGMVAVPEPSTALLLGLGLVGMAARRRV